VNSTSAPDDVWCSFAGNQGVTRTSPVKVSAGPIIGARAALVVICICSADAAAAVTAKAAAANVIVDFMSLSCFDGGMPSFL
jgi:hypothetical protein